MADRRLTAQWAYVGKAPATLAYGVLATSGGETDFGAFVGRYATGSPDRAMLPDAPGAPPWVTFGPMVTAAEDILVLVSVQEPAQDRDKSGRPISPQKLFLFRYADLAEAGVSYQGLWMALADVVLPLPDQLPLPVDVAGHGLEDLTPTIEHYGVERMTALAAMILENRIVLADSARLPRAERLAVLDAALALLPYGFRAALSASSGVDNATAHEIDLVFAEFVNEKLDQDLASLSAKAPIPMPRTKLGRAYQDMLRDKIGNLGLPAVLEHLWAATSPCSLQHQNAALQILGQLDFDGSLRRALGDGTATVAEVVSFFRRDPALVGASWRSSAMTVPLRRSALRLLLDGGDGPAAELVLASWPAIGDDLFADSSSSLDTGDPARAIWCLRIAGQYSADHKDLFLARLLGSDQAAKENRKDRAQALVRLLGKLEPPQLGDLPLTRDQLCQDQDEAWAAEIVQALLAGQVRSGSQLDQAIAWGSWLCLPGPEAVVGVPAWAATLQLVCDATVSPAHGVPVVDLIWAGVALRLASHISRLASILPFLLDHLVLVANDAAAAAARPGHPATLPHDMRFLLESLDVDLVLVGVPADAVARADVLRVLLGGNLRGFPSRADDERFLDGYLDGLGHTLRRLPERSSSWVAARVLSVVVPDDPRRPLTAAAIWLLNTWSADPDLGTQVARHIAAMDESGRPVDDRLVASYWERIGLVPGLAGYASTPRLAAAFRAVLAEPRTLARWTGPNGVNNTPFALSWHKARQAGLPVSEILRILGVTTHKRIEPGRLDDVIREFQGLMHHDPDLTATSREDLFACYEGVAGGVLGDHYALTFSRETIIRLEGEIRLREELIRRLGGTPLTGRRKRLRLGRGTRSQAAAGQTAAPAPAGDGFAPSEMPGGGQRA